MTLSKASGNVAKLRDIFNVREFGAIGDGTADDTNAIKEAIQAAQDAFQGYAGVLTTFTIPTIYFPKGVYKITSILTPDTNGAVSWMKFEGDGSILQAAAGITVFGGVSTNVYFDHLQFQGGACGISIKTNNLDTAVIAATRCTFVGQTTVCAQIDATSQSTMVTFRDCKFITVLANPGSQVWSAQSCDTITFVDCWVSARNDAGAAFRTAGKTIFRNMLGVPITSLSAWIENYGSLDIHQTRFGGESGGAATIVRNYTTSTTSYPVTPSYIRMTDSTVYCTAAVISFYAIPNQVILRGCEGFVDTDAWYVDTAAVGTGDLNYIGNLGSMFVSKDNVNPMTTYIDYLYGNAKAQKGLPFANGDFRKQLSYPPSAGEVVINSVGFTGAFGLATNNTATLTTPAGRFTDTTATFTATANGQTFNYSYTTMLNGLSAGIYTLVIGVAVTTDHIIQCQVTASNSSELFVVPRGEHVLNLPFYYDGSSPQAVSVGGSLPNTGVIVFQRYVIYRGQRVFNDRRVLFEGTAAPGSGAWVIGDRLVNSTPTVGQPKAWICTVSGSPGTWVSEGNL